MFDTDRLRHTVARAAIRINPPVSEAVVEVLQDRARVVFPSDYVEFVTKVANGGHGACRLIPVEQWSAAYWIDDPRPEHLAVPCVMRPDAVQHGKAWLDVCGPRNWEADFDENRWDPVCGSIAVAEIGCGLFYSLIVNGPFRGRVYSYGDHTSNPPRFVEEATFGDWIARQIEASAAGRPVHFLDDRLS